MAIAPPPRRGPPSAHHTLVLSPLPVVCAGIASLVRSEIDGAARVFCGDWSAWRRVRAAISHELHLVVVHPGNICDFAELASLISEIGNKEVILAFPLGAKSHEVLNNAKLHRIELGASLEIWRRVLRTAALRGVIPQKPGNKMQMLAIGAHVSTPVQTLTPRQMEVLELLTRGFPNGAIAQRLGITQGTAKLHVAAVLRALSARRRVDLVLRRASGLLTAHDDQTGRNERAAQVMWPLSSALDGERETEK